MIDNLMNTFLPGKAEKRTVVLFFLILGLLWACAGLGWVSLIPLGIGMVSGAVTAVSEIRGSRQDVFDGVARQIDEKRVAEKDSWYDNLKAAGKIAGTQEWLTREIAESVIQASQNDLGFPFRVQQLGMDIDSTLAWAEEIVKPTPLYEPTSDTELDRAIIKDARSFGISAEHAASVIAAITRDLDDYGRDYE